MRPNQVVSKLINEFGQKFICESFFMNDQLGCLTLGLDSTIQEVLDRIAIKVEQ